MLSTAPDGLETNDPITEWPKTDRIVCYCACPNHLSSLRAASLRSQGYQEVYALKEGYLEWQEQKYPMAGDEITSRSAVHVINEKTESRTVLSSGPRHSRSPSCQSRLYSAD